MPIKFTVKCDHFLVWLGPKGSLTSVSFPYFTPEGLNFFLDSVDGYSVDLMLKLSQLLESDIYANSQSVLKHKSMLWHIASRKSSAG